jgi:hypothetical protein
MILHNVSTNAGNASISIHIKEELMPISSLQITFDNAIAFPGLINSHDHLDFNLFPPLRDSAFNNYTEWGNHIHKHFKDEINAVLKVPFKLRIQWGTYKNLLCGVTSVINHGDNFKVDKPLINVLCKEHSIHSVQFEKKWKLKLNNPLKGTSPAVIHIGEGIDDLSHAEIDELIRWNLLRRRLIGIHGIAMSNNQAQKFRALVWCPESNYFLFNRTAAIDQLKNHTTILFGTDSTLTSNWNLWEHIRLAQRTNLLTEMELYQSLTEKAAAVWNIQNDANLVVAKRNNNDSFFKAFYNINSEDLLLVLHNGNIKLFDETLLPQLSRIDLKKYSRIFIGGSYKYVEGDLKGLVRQVKQYYPEANIPFEIKDLEPEYS